MAGVTNWQLSKSRKRISSRAEIPEKENDVRRSSEFYLNMIQAELDQAKEALAEGYVGRVRNLIHYSRKS